MNRIQLASQEQISPSQDTFSLEQSEVEQGVLQTASRDGCVHTFFLPLHYEKNYSYPLLIWLHSDSDDQRQLQRVMPLISMRNYVAVAPRGNCIDGGEKRSFGWQQTPRAIELSEQSVLDCVELARDRFNVAPKRIFVAGYRSGGTMALRLGLQNPEIFAGALSVGGPFPQGNAPLLHLDRARQLPLFIAQGRQSESYPISQACEELRLFHAAGMCVTLRQYPGGDELTTKILSDMDDWLMEQVTGQPSSPQEDSPRISDDVN